MPISVDDMNEYGIENLEASEHSKKLAKLLLGKLSELPPWDDIGTGYWPTVYVYWFEAKVEVEVHKDSFEYYDLSEEIAIILEFSVDELGKLVELLSTRLSNKQ